MTPTMIWESCWSWMLYIRGENNAADTLSRVREESLDVESCVNCGSAFIWDKTLHHCDFLNTRTEQKHFLNQGPGSFTLFGPEYIDEKRKSRVEEMLWVWKNRWNAALEQSHQNLIGLRFDLQLICMKLHHRNGLGRQPEAMLVHLLMSCFDPSMWTFSSANITSTSPRNSLRWADQTRCFLFNCSPAHCFRGNSH